MTQENLLQFLVQMGFERQPTAAIAAPLMKRFADNTSGGLPVDFSDGKLHKMSSETPVHPWTFPEWIRFFQTTTHQSRR